jgi:glycine oxidase
VVSVQCEKGTLSRPVRIYHRYPIYLVPRNDGRIVIGATSEEQSDENITAGGVLDLIYAAWQALPLVYEKPIVQTWAGLRPTTPDHKPIFGVGPHDNSYVLTGLYRHGIMLAPFAAKELVDLMNGKKMEMAWEEFSYGRFNEQKIAGEDTSPLRKL